MKNILIFVSLLVLMGGLYILNETVSRKDIVGAYRSTEKESTIYLRPGNTGVTVNSFHHELVHHAKNGPGGLLLDVPTAAAMGTCAEWILTGDIENTLLKSLFLESRNNPKKKKGFDSIMKYYISQHRMVESEQTYRDGAKLAGYLCNDDFMKTFILASFGLYYDELHYVKQKEKLESLIFSFWSGSYDEIVLELLVSSVNEHSADLRDVLDFVNEKLAGNYRFRKTHISERHASPIDAEGLYDNRTERVIKRILQGEYTKTLLPNSELDALSEGELKLFKSYLETRIDGKVKFVLAERSGNLAVRTIPKF